MPAYYLPLDAEGFEVRLLKLNPGQFGSPIKCSILHESLLQPPSYIALSYRWGDPTLVKTIHIDGNPVAITVNLEVALQRLRQRGADLVWADAVCINHDDKQEKSTQIRMMRHVYEKSRHTYAWLGGAEGDRAAQAICFLRDILVKMESQFPELHVLARSDVGLRGDRGSARRDITQRLVSQMPLNWIDGQMDHAQLEFNFQALLDLLRREYWTRRWIIQEVAVATRTDILCGDNAISLGALVVLLMACTGSSCWTTQHDTSSERLSMILKFRQAYQANLPLSLCKALSDSQDFKSQDPRDRLFALMGICDDGQILVPLPSYYQDVDTISREFSRALLKHVACFDIILLADHPESSSATLPTWSPDWLSPTRVSPQVFILGQQHSSVDRSLIVDSLTGDSLVLRVHGVMLGTVLKTTSVLGGVQGLTEVPQSSQSPARWRYRARRPSCKYYQGHHVLYHAITACMVTTRNQRALFSRYEHFRFRQCLKDPSQSPRDRSRRDGEPEHTVYDIFRHWRQINSGFMVDNVQLNKWLEQSLTEYCLYMLANIETTGMLIMALAMVVLVLFTGISAIASGPHLSLTVWLIIGSMLLFTMLGPLFCSMFCDSHMNNDYGIAEIREHTLVTSGDYEDALHQPRRLIVLDSGAIGMACPRVMVNDKVCLLAGCQLAAVLRASDSDNDEVQYRVVGQASLVLGDRDIETFLWLSPLNSGATNNTSSTRRLPRATRPNFARPQLQTFELI